MISFLIVAVLPISKSANVLDVIISVGIGSVVVAASVNKSFCGSPFNCSALASSVVVSKGNTSCLVKGILLSA